jgi:hypothetical protein
MSRCATPSSSLSRDELVLRIRAARERNATLDRTICQKDADIKKLRGQSVESQQAADVEGEKINNILSKRVDSLQKSNHDIEATIKAGERRNAAVLAELARVRKSKVEVENRIEAEQERMLNTLQKQLLNLAGEKSRLERQLQSNREEVLSSLQAEIDRLRSRAQTPSQNNSTSTSFANESGSLSASRTRLDNEPTGALPPSSQASPNRKSSAASPSSDRIAAASQVHRLENELLRLVGETKKSAEEAERSEQQYEHLADQLRQLQDSTLLAKVRMAKMREDLEKAQSELAAERGSGGATPLRSHDGTPLVGGAGVGVGVASAALLGGSSCGQPLAWPPASARRVSHARTQSGSSVESWSSASVVSATPLNVALARPDPDLVRQHTARVLSSATVYPSPMRSTQHEHHPTRSGSRSGRSSAAPQPIASTPSGSNRE